MTVPTKIRTFKMHFNVLNVLLLAGIVLIYLQFIAPLTRLNAIVKMPTAKMHALNPVTKATDLQFPSYADFMVIADKNLFHPERKIPVEIKPGPVEQKPELILYGTLITDNLRVAYIEEKRAGQSPATTQNTTGRNKSQRTMKLGDNIRGYVLKSIENESVTFVKGDDKIYLSLKEQRRNRATYQETHIGTLPAQRAAAPGKVGPAMTFPPSTNNSAPQPNLELRRPVR